MKYRIIVLFAAAAALFACGKPEDKPTPPADPVLILQQTSLSFGKDGGSQTVSFLANLAWTATSSQGWATVSPASGQGSSAYQGLTVTAAANTGDTRTAQITVSVGNLSATLSVTQLNGDGGTASLSISEFRSKSVDKTTWYKLTGEIVGISNTNFGNFYIADETSYVYVYGLCEKKVDTNDQSFSKLNLKVGDKVSMMTLRSEYNGEIEAGGTIPAYYLSHESGTYKMGRKESAASAKWIELPATSASDGKDLLVHLFPDGKQRSYSAYWDYDNLVSIWVAYPLYHFGDNNTNIGKGTRTVDSTFPMDPLLDADKQPLLTGGYLEGNAGKFDRGHQIPSADRLHIRTNIETFFSTNMTPQVNGLNSNIWGTLEQKIRDWTKKEATDTMYVVTGCVTEGSNGYVFDRAEKRVTVPVGYYKALLRLAKDRSTGTSGYTGLAIWFDNKENKATSITKEMVMSIDALEDKVGVDFFVNLPANIQDAVETENPASVSWWWNN